MDLTTVDVDDAMDAFSEEPDVAAELFARHIHDTWGVGSAEHGGTGVLIFLSVEDRIVYFSRGKALERVLRDRRMDAIITGMKPLLRNRQYDKAILWAIAELDQYLQAGPGVSLFEFLLDWYETIVGLIVFVVFGWFVRKDIVDRRNYARVATHLTDLDRARAEALQGTFRATSCPICLENFKMKSEFCTVINEGEAAATTAVETQETEPLVGTSLPDTNQTTESPQEPDDDSLVGSDGLPLQLLRCGHTFDETCWQEWISNGNTNSIHKCPICQQDVGEQPETSSSSSLSVDPLSIPRGGGGPNDDGDQTMSRRQRQDTNEEREEAIRNELRSLVLRQYTQERNFRLLRLALRYPQYIQRNELQQWTKVSYNGSLAQDAQLARQAAIEASEKSSWSSRFGDSSNSGFGSSSSGFGGGWSSGGRGGSW
jgi:uncharacterized membrane protein YgcG